MPKLIKPLTLAVTGLVTLGLSMFSLGSAAAYAAPSKRPSPASVAQGAANFAPAAPGGRVTKSGNTVSGPNVSSSGANTTINTTSGKSAVTAHGPHGTVTVSLPNANGQDAQVVSVSSSQGASDTVVFSPSTGDTPSTVVQPIADGSTRIMTVIPSAASGNTVTYPMSLPTGARLSLQSDGSAEVVGAGDTVVAYIAVPWAKDGSGRSLATSYTIQGTSLVQHIVTNQTTVYPVTADPWLGLTLISSVWWENVSKWSPTLAVVPTWYGRYLAPTVAVWAAWAEVVKKAPSANTYTMSDQFACHWDFARIYAPNKPSWDLDSKRPDASIVVQLNYRCNYPDGSKVW